MSRDADIARIAALKTQAARRALDALDGLVSALTFGLIVKELAAAEAEAAALDVERLARAMHGGTLGCDRLDQRHIDPMDGHREHARVIALEYARALLPTQASDSPEKTT